MTFRNPVLPAPQGEPVRQFSEAHTNVRVRLLLNAMSEMQEIVARQQMEIEHLRMGLENLTK